MIQSYRTLLILALLIFGASEAQSQDVVVFRTYDDFVAKNRSESYAKDAALDIMWDNLIIFKVNKYISSTFSTNLIWDKDVIIEEVGGPAVQFKHVFTIGFLANF